MLIVVVVVVVVVVFELVVVVVPETFFFSNLLIAFLIGQGIVLLFLFLLCIKYDNHTHGTWPDPKLLICYLFRNLWRRRRRFFFFRVERFSFSKSRTSTDIYRWRWFHSLLRLTWRLDLCVHNMISKNIFHFFRFLCEKKKFRWPFSSFDFTVFWDWLGGWRLDLCVHNKLF